MDQKIKEKWLNALRSGKYQMGKTKLRNTDNNTGEQFYCCLGVLCDLYIKEFELGNLTMPDELTKPHWRDDFFVQRDGQTQRNYLAFEVAEWAGLYTQGEPYPDPEFDPELLDVAQPGLRCYPSLAKTNDSKEVMSFGPIVRIIEKAF